MYTYTSKILIVTSLFSDVDLCKFNKTCHDKYCLILD